MQETVQKFAHQMGIESNRISIKTNHNSKKPI
jgi:hypothetical protein